MQVQAATAEDEKNGLNQLGPYSIYHLQEEISRVAIQLKDSYNIIRKYLLYCSSPELLRRQRG